MPEPKLRLHFHEPAIDLNMPITAGLVKIEGFDLEFIDQGQPDVWDGPYSTLVGDKAHDAPQICVPAFPNRKFRLAYIFVNSAAGIESPSDLEGRRVGIGSWSNNATVWSKGALQHYYGVDLSRINWVATRLEPEIMPEGIAIEPLGPRGDRNAMLMALDSGLVSGELDAVIQPNVLPSISRRDPRVRRLLRDYKTEEQNYFKETGIFPISHIMTLRQDFVDRYPEAPIAVLKAFRTARDMAFDNIQGSDPQTLVISWASALLDEQRTLMGENYWAYNIEDNRPTLEAMTQYAHEQGLTSFRVDYNDLFAPEAAAFPGQ